MPSQKFETCDLYMAAFFVSQDVEMTAPSKDANGRVTFAFNLADDEDVALLTQWTLGNAQCNATHFADACKRLKQLVHRVGTLEDTPIPLEAEVIRSRRRV
jgi:hypothetical protein